MKRLTAVLLVLLAFPLLADEGMWMPQQVPQLGDELRKAGLQIDPQRFADLTGDPMGAVISLGGCTASFVSPQGLIVTNHHCAYGSIQFNSSKERDLIVNGFLAKSMSDELPAAPGSRVFVTTKIEDVTGRVTGKIPAKTGDRERAKLIERRIKELVEEVEKEGGVRARVASFFEGSQYLRITQMEIRDVRLVYAPAEGIGNFGGETDNWMWPRHTGDFAFFRAWVGPDDKPADFAKENVPFRPAHYLKVSTEGVDEGDLVMVAGYPGRTFRYRTEQEVRMAKDYTYPMTIKYATELNRILNEIGKSDRQIQIRNASRIKGNDNVLKNYQGTMANFSRGIIIEHRAKREADLKAWLAANPAAAKKYGGVLDRIRQINDETYATMQRDFTAQWLFRASPMLSQAMRIYRWSIEKTKKDLDRAPGYQERDVPSMLQASARTQASIHEASDRAGLRYFLLEATRLPADQRIKALDEALAATGASGVEAQVDRFLDTLYGTTKIADADQRKAMYGETTAQLDARNDGMLQFVASLMPMMLANEERDDRLGGAMSRVRPLYLEALREMSGGRMYPDANGTLRVTFGKVTGYRPRDAVRYDAQTGVTGVVEKHTGSGEFDAPQALVEAIRAKKFGPYADPQLGEVAVNFLSTCDTTGGNSGSPTLNAKGELTGLLFDGNYEALGSDFLPNPAITRSIHVDATYMLWVMDAVDRAHNLLQEMGIAPKF
ncbi:MAG TPA: S46 family peptidase [Thermoanaerobaculia bacterium]|nr:S46 family peptidase [Thermoanaerobaculia bacterium]